TTEKAIGEAATTSLYLPQSVGRIKKYISNAKFIAILRQPAERAYSSYMHLIRDHREPVKDFREALKLEDRRIADHWGFMWHYTSMGFYYEQIKRFYDNFDREQIRIYLHDEFAENPLYVIQDIFTFLEVDPTFEPYMQVKANVSGIQKSKLVEMVTRTLFEKPNPLRYVARRTISQEQRWRMTTMIQNSNLKRQTLSPTLHHELTELFREDIIKLQDLIDKDLTHWLT
ncbi:MAG TPA: sulfotransferase, partial [Anaerolineae bacterium]|nr:sulfotransferase [Anaerolineae bacterium]